MDVVIRMLSFTLLPGAALLAVPIDFVRDVRPIFEHHCHECHGPEKQKSGFRLDVKREAFTAGDEHAPNIVAGRSAQSPLFRFISGADQELIMPPKGKGEPLSTAEIGIIRRWLDEGAVWPDEADTTKLADRTDWWSFKPLKKLDGSAAPSAKTSVAGTGVHGNRIDAFVLAKLAEKGLSPSPEADARTLIRRLCFDLTGLPPSPEQSAAFVNDKSPGAYEKLVDALLASPRYGERWARHWLDVVHYGESHGYDKDQPRRNAWPYRDYVIRALNTDKPYARFIEEQLAGDALHPGTMDGITALGFIAAGPWDLIGHVEVPETKIDGKIARHLDRDDMVQNAIGTFCSLTIQCAQCHNHKFDPITQEDYYSLQAVFAAVDRTEADYYPDDATMRKLAAIKEQRRGLENRLEALEAPLRAGAGANYASLTKRIQGAAEKTKNPNARPDFGYHSAISMVQDAVKWVQVDLGRSVQVERVVLKPCYDDFGGIGGGFGFPVRFKIEVSDDPEFKKGVSLVWRKHDATFMNDFPNPGLHAFDTNTGGDDGVTGRFVRVTTAKLAPRRNDYIFALAEMEVYAEKNGPNIAASRPVAALDSIETPPRWRMANLTDGIAPESRSAVDKEQLMRARDDLLLDQADESTRRELLDTRQQLLLLPTLNPPSRVYAGIAFSGSGNFKGTGGVPRPIHILKRGDIKQPAREVGPNAIQSLSALFNLPFKIEGADESARRMALAKWITGRNNALTWRSIVNRVWQHHFGRGLVDTPNDFGHMGGEPTHPELLDWLAVVFRDEMGGSLKRLHKLIVMSRTYRQTSRSAESTFKTDAANIWLSHQNRRKLDAECVRDSILAVSGRLDLSMGGPGFQDFVITHPEHSPHYEYDLHDPQDPRCWRRSIYRFIVRSQQQPFMTVMDCADPSMRVDKRNESLSPLQALAMMNNGLTVAMAGHFAERVAHEARGIEDQVRRAFELALSRPPSDDELAPLAQYAAREGLQNACRVILNLNEFSFVD